MSRASIALACAVAVTAAAPAYAEPITVIESQVSGEVNACLPCGIFNPVDLTLLDTTFNGTPVSGGGPLQIWGGYPGAATVSDGVTTYAITGTPSMFKTMNYAGGTVTFSLTLTSIVVNELTPDTAWFHGTEVLQSATGPYDFSAFSGGGAFTMMLNAPGVDFNTLFADGGTVGASGWIRQSASVPESGSVLLVAGPALLAAAWFSRSRRALQH